MERLKQYTLDTNVLRYRTNQDDGKDLRDAARIFWRKVENQINNNKAVLLLPKEVIRELEVQSFTLKKSQNQKISKLLGICSEIFPDNLTNDIEHSIRKMSAYIRANHRENLERDKIGYGDVSDARILYTAYYEESILVTSNVRDFMLYPLLFPQEEERLYDLKENAFVQIPSDGYQSIHKDTAFRTMLYEFYHLEDAKET